MKLLDKIKNMPDRVEATLRATLASFMAYCFSVGAPPNVTPSSLAYFIGIMVASFATSFPTLMFAAALCLPGLLVFVCLGLIFASMLQAASSVSDGLLVFVFTCHALWMCGSLRYGPDRDKTASLAGPLVMLPAMMATSFRTTIQDGVTVPVRWPPEGSEDLFRVARDVLEAVCLLRDLPSDCWKDNLPIDDGAFEIDISKGILEGQTVTLEFDEGSSTLFISLEGGLWWVAALWTEKGLNNPLANNRNLLIAFCWVSFCLAVGMCLPPFRTLRKALSRAMIPGALINVQAALGDAIQPLEDGNGDGDEADHDDAVVKKITERREAHVTKLTRDLNTFFGGGSAMMTAFEYRILTAPFECTWPILKELMTSTFNMVYIAIGIAKSRPAILEEEQINEAMSNAMTVVEACAKTLVANEDPKVALEALRVKDDESPSAEDHDLLKQSNRLIIILSQRVLKSTIAWQNAMLHPDSPSPCKKQGLKNMKQTYGFMLGVPLIIFKKLFSAFLVLFHPDTWDLETFLEYLKYPTGFIALFVMNVYWDGYNEVALDLDNFGVSGLYSGWNLIAYSSSWLPTLEGTVKKGTARMIGTSFGGFSAWLAIIICSGSYDIEAEINPYGLVAWLTITSGIVFYFNAPDGFAARMGMSKDHGYVGMYFTVTQALCALEVFAGSGERDDIIVNRIIANLSGIAMAIAMQMIPPYTRGGDPKHSRAILMVLVDALKDGLDILLSQQDSGDSTSESLDQLKPKVQKDFMVKRVDAQFLLKDATRMTMLKFLVPNPKLAVEIEDMMVTASLVYSFLSFSSYLAKTEHVDGLLDPSSQYYQDLEDAMKELLGETRTTTKHFGEGMQKEAGMESVDEYVETVLKLLWGILRRMEIHDKNLMSLDGTEFLEKLMDE